MGRSTQIDDWWSAEDIGAQLGMGRGTNPISALGWSRLHGSAGRGGKDRRAQFLASTEVILNQGQKKHD